MAHKLTILIPDETKTILDDIKATKEMSATEQIRRAVGLFNHILSLQNEGHEFRVMEKDGNYRKIEIIL